VVESEENPKTVSLSFHRPWKSLEGAIPTFPPRRQLFYLSKTQNRKEHPGAGLRSLSSGSSFAEKMLQSAATTLRSMCMTRKLTAEGAQS
jgi:hypothetical protein